MTKKVTFGTKKGREAAADAWVQSAAAPQSPLSSTPSDDIPMKRLTIDVSEDLHKRIKTQCAANGLKMADEIRAILEERFPPQ